MEETGDAGVENASPPPVSGMGQGWIVFETCVRWGLGIGEALKRCPRFADLNEEVQEKPRKRIITFTLGNMEVYQDGADTLCKVRLDCSLCTVDDLKEVILVLVRVGETSDREFSGKVCGEFKKLKPCFAADGTIKKIRFLPRR